MFRSPYKKFWRDMFTLILSTSCLARGIHCQVDAQQSTKVAPSARSTEVVSSYNEGMCAFVRGKYQEALEKFEKAIDKNPNNSAAYYYLALASQKLGNYKQARSYYDFVLQHFPQSKAYPLARKVHNNWL